MTLADAVAAVLFLAVIAYAVFGGADFGSGVWDLTAGRASRGAPLRRLVDHAIGPVWEANHVWLVFVLVFLWGGFPEPFTDLMRATAIPMWLAALGIVARGAAFAFRKYSPTMAWAQVAGIVFAGASLVTPFFLGTVAGAVAEGRVPADPAPGELSMWSPWLGPVSIMGGILAVATCTFLAGVFLTAEAAALGQDELADTLRRRSLIGGVITGAVAIAGIPLILAEGGPLRDGLLGRALPLIVISGVCGVATMWLLATSRLAPARLTATAAVASVVAGWGVAQYPWILVNETTIAEGAGAPATLVGLLVTTALAAVLVVPALVYLFALAERDQLQ